SIVPRNDAWPVARLIWYSPEGPFVPLTWSTANALSNAPAMSKPALPDAFSPSAPTVCRVPSPIGLCVTSRSVALSISYSVVADGHGPQLGRHRHGGRRRTAGLEVVQLHRSGAGRAAVVAEREEPAVVDARVEAGDAVLRREARHRDGHRGGDPGRPAAEVVD